MTERKRNKPPNSLDMDFGEVLSRFAQTKPGEVADAIARELADSLKEANERIKSAREDIKRGARTGKSRFRL